jgi:ribosomal protein L7/L12
MKLTLKATCTVREALTLLSGMPSDAQLRIESVAPSVAEAKTKRQLALEAAAPHAQTGNKIKAIQAWREVTGDGLAEAKNAVESEFATQLAAAWSAK